MEKEPLPTVDFDPALHVVECRERREGRTVLVTLQSLSDAERQYAAVQPAPNPVDISNVVNQAVADVERRILEAMQQAVPPPQIATDVQAVLGDITQVLAMMQARIADLEKQLATTVSRVDLAERSLLGIAS